MNRSLLLGPWLACLAWCQPATATPLLPDFSEFYLLADTISPIITCPASDTVQLGPNECGQAVSYTVTATDNQPGFTVVQASGLVSGAIFPIGTTVNSFVALDTSNNTATCSFTITVQNYYNVLICRQLPVIKLNANCSYTVVPTDILEPNENGCSANFLIEVDKTFPLGNGPWLPAVMTMADVNKSYQFRVTAPTTGNRCFSVGEIKDTLPPSISCQDISIPFVVSNLEPDYLNDSLSISTSRPAYTDNCGNALTLKYNDTAVSLLCDTASVLTGIVTRTWTVKDAGNNQSTCVQKINRVRSLTDVQFPADVTINCDNPDVSPQTNGFPFYAVGEAHFPLLPNSSYEIEVNSLDTLVPHCGGTRLLRRTWRVYEVCRPLSASNPKIGVQNLEIQDTGAPTIACPPTTVLRADGLGCQGKVKLPDAVITDGCSDIAAFTAEWPATEGGQVLGNLRNWPGNNPALRDTLGGLDSLDFPTGATVIHYVATDRCGNTGSCSFTIVVSDTMPPTAFCRPLMTVQLSTAGTFQLPADSLDDGSTDECNAVSFKVRRQLPNPCQANNQFYDSVAFCCSDIGDTVALRVRVYDVPLPAGALALSFDSAYSSECTVRVRVTDLHLPQCTAPPDLVVDCASFDPSLKIYGNLLDRSCSAELLQILVNYDQFDTICRRGQLIRTFHVADVAGNSSECTQQITVNDGQYYFVRFPDDVVATTCSVSDSFGQPQLFGLDCERTQVTFTDQVINSAPGACFRIERTWKIINYCHYDSLQPLTIVPNPEPDASPDSLDNLLGPTVSANGSVAPWAPTLSKLTPTSAAQTNFSNFWSADVNGYQYKQVIRFIDNQAPIFENCPATATTFADSTINSNELWNEPYWFDPTTAIHDLSDASILLSATAFDACRGENISLHYTLFLDLDGSGNQETVVKSTHLPAFGTINFGNGFNTNYTGGTPQNFDERTVPNSQKYGFALETAIVNHKKTAWVRWNTAQTPGQYSNPQLPRGQHKILWTAEDGCGNTTTCQYNFTIRDGLPPALSCAGISLQRNIAPDHTLKLHVSEFQKNASDNYSPTSSLQYALQRPGAGGGFPLDSTGNPIRTVTYTCDELGLQNVLLWVRDQENNTNFCTTTVTVQDPDSFCTEPVLAINGTVSTPSDTGVTDVRVGIYATYLGLLPYSSAVTTDSAGGYVSPISFPSGTAYTLTPMKDGNALNGVTTYDLVLISRHILGLSVIASPYKLIAADANKSNSVTALDVVELRRLILGIYDKGLPNIKSWRFVDKSFVFPNPGNPFQTTFPETRSVASLAASQVADDFVAIKIGDVDYSAFPNGSGPADDRTTGTLWFEVADRAVRSGETVDVVFRAAEVVAGYQFTLDYPGLEVVNIQPGAAMQPDNFAVFTTRNALTTSFNATGMAHPAEFTVRFRARQTGRLSQLLRLSGQITPAYAYPAKDASPPFGIALRFGPTDDPSSTFELLPCTPNPFTEQTMIGFRLPVATIATLSVFDAVGRAVYVRTADYTAGFHTVPVYKKDLGSCGTFFYELQTPTGHAVRKMLLLP